MTRIKTMQARLRPILTEVAAGLVFVTGCLVALVPVIGAIVAAGAILFFAVKAVLS